MYENRAARRSAMRFLKTYRKSEVRNDKSSPHLTECLTEYDKRLVFRIEHPESGKGPYTHNSGRGIFASDAMVCLAEPNDFNAPQLRIGSPHRYGFESIEKLFAAVQSLVLLRELGFHITVYESNEHVVLPDGQVAFIKEKSVQLRSNEIHEFPYDDYI